MNLMSAVAAAPALTLTPSAEAAAQNETKRADRRAWDALMSKERALQQQIDCLAPLVDAAEAAFDDRRPELDVIEWSEFPYQDRHYVARVLDIDTYERQRLDAEGKTWWSPQPEVTRERIKAACRSVRHFRSLEKIADRQARRTELNDRYDALNDAIADIHDALMQMPMPDLQAFHWKLMKVCPREYGAYTEEYTAQFYADAERLLTMH